MNEYTARESTILGILRNQYAMFSKNEQPMNAYNYSAIDWDELTALAIVAPEYVAYIPPNPKGNPMYETGKHVILPAIMQLPENIGKVKETETSTEIKQVRASASDREELRENGYTYHYEDSQHVWRDSSDTIVGKDTYLGMATAQAYAVWQNLEADRLKQQAINQYFEAFGQAPAIETEAPIDVEALQARIAELTQAIEKALTKLDSYDGLYPSVKAAQATLQAAIQAPEVASTDLQKGTLVLTIGEKKPSTARIERIAYIHEDNVGKVYKVRYLSGILGQTWWEAKDLQALAGDTALS